MNKPAISASRCLTATMLLFSSTTAMALDVARPAYTPPPAAVSAGGLIQVTLSLLLVLAAIVAVAWLLKRMNLAQQGTGNFLKVIGSVAIGQRERVVLVEVGDTWLLVGVGPSQIRTLHTMAKDLQSDFSPASTPDNKFARLLSSMLKPRSSNGHDNAP